MLSDFIIREPANQTKDLIDMWRANYITLKKTINEGPVIEVDLILYGRHYASNIVESRIEEEYIYPILMVNDLLYETESSEPAKIIKVPSIPLMGKLLKHYNEFKYQQK